MRDESAIVFLDIAIDWLERWIIGEDVAAVFVFVRRGGWNVFCRISRVKFLRQCREWVLINANKTLREKVH
jgi:hypothetical protein